MHEMAITIALVDVLNEEIERAGGGRLVDVVLTVGGLGALEPGALSACFETVVEGTALEGARLSVRRLPIRIHCRGCRADGICDEHFRCLDCGGTDLVVLGSEPMRVESMTMTK
ncbi:MAG: hydrogenase maturation nickel metallochaperone HypA [Phyllobacteriaceae bacterium]|nr:hydrogenase maturation nickel metallochaperone HypA [Phyllobacteriaceae bacterium]